MQVGSRNCEAIMDLCLQRGRLEIPHFIQRARLLDLLSQYTTSIQVSYDCYSFMTGMSSYNSHLTPVNLLHTEKRGEAVLPYVFVMAFPPSPFVQPPLYKMSK